MSNCYDNLVKMEERDSTWLVGDEDKNAIFLKLPEGLICIEIIPMNYPGFAILAIKNEKEAVEAIHEYYSGYAVRKNNLGLDIKVNWEGDVDPSVESDS